MDTTARRKWWTIYVDCIPTLTGLGFGRLVQFHPLPQSSRRPEITKNRFSAPRTERRDSALICTETLRYYMNIQLSRHNNIAACARAVRFEDVDDDDVHCRIVKCCAILDMLVVVVVGRCVLLCGTAPENRAHGYVSAVSTMTTTCLCASTHAQALDRPTLCTIIFCAPRFLCACARAPAVMCCVRGRIG